MIFVFLVSLLCIVKTGVATDITRLSVDGSISREDELDPRLIEKIENMFAKKMATIYTKWEKEKAQMQQRIHLLEQKLDDRVDIVYSDPKKRLLMAINSTSQGHTNPSQVAFYARNVSPDRNLPIHETLKFGGVLTNLGNSYHSTSGIFVCFTSGYYVFSVNILLDPGNGLRTSLVQNGARQEFFLCANAGNYHNCGGTVILHVQAGDTIYIRTESTMSSHIIGWESGFSGFLLYAD